MPVRSLRAKAGTVAFILIGLGLLAFGLFVSHRVNVMADELVEKKAKTQADVLNGKASTTVK